MDPFRKKYSANSRDYPPPSLLPSIDQTCGQLFSNYLSGRNWGGREEAGEGCKISGCCEKREVRTIICLDT